MKIMNQKKKLGFTDITSGRRCIDSLKKIIAQIEKRNLLKRKVTMIGTLISVEKLALVLETIIMTGSSSMDCKDCKWNEGFIDEEGVFIDCVWHSTEKESVPPCSSEAELCW